LFIPTGAAIKIRADRALVGLRKRGGPHSCSIPRGGLFDRVPCPNHFSEIIEWTGFVLACKSLPYLAHTIWTAANMGHRAVARHRWCEARFFNSRAERRTLITDLL